MQVVASTGYLRPEKAASGAPGRSSLAVQDCFYCFLLAELVSAIVMMTPLKRRRVQECQWANFAAAMHLSE